MDLDKWIEIIRSVPKEKLKSDEGLRDVIRQIARNAGKNVSEQQLNQYVAQFRSMARTGSVGSLMNRLSQKGIKPQELEKIKKRLRK
ncbi:MAG: stage VI sporulation protein F [Brevibacillus sp.]|nr:stage VI sporulation protein F [Brevibacillus sp.]